MLRIMGVRVSRAPCGALALLALVLLLCHAFVLPVVSRPIREGRELLSKSEVSVSMLVSCNYILNPGLVPSVRVSGGVCLNLELSLYLSKQSPLELFLYMSRKSRPLELKYRKDSNFIS